MRTFLCQLLLLFFFTSPAQYFSEQETKEDLQALKQSFLLFQPKVLQYNPALDSLSSIIIANVTSPQSPIEYFKKVSEICALANEGHTVIGSWNDSFHSPIINNEVRYMPLEVKIIDGKIYAWDVLCDAQFIEKGDQIVSINKISSKKILEQLKRYTCFDGSIDTYFYKKVEAGFNWMYSFYIDQPENFELELRSFETGAKQTAFLPALKRGQQQEYQRNSRLQRPARPGQSDFYSLDFREDLAILTMRSFDGSLMNQLDLKSGKIYRSLFRQFRKRRIQQLVIDLRGNTGGRDEFADDMLPYLLKQKRKEILKTITSWKGDTIQTSVPRKKLNAFKGKIYVLVDGLTYESAANLSKYIETYADGMIIGQETGSRYEGYAGGSYEYVYLPNSKLRIGIACYRIEFPGLPIKTMNNRGQIPDHTLIPGIMDEMNDRDETMRFLMKDLLSR